MNEKLLEIRQYAGEGYQPLIDFGTWRVAFLRYIDELIPWNITRVERHLETDEVFVLLDGQAVLFLGGGEERVENLAPVVMEPGRLYNVKCNAWHTIVLSHDATILLVENRDTGQANMEYSLLRAVHCQLIIDTARREQPGEWDAA
jgi:ureidoglycolate hydrolase